MIVIQESKDVGIEALSPGKTEIFSKVAYTNEIIPVETVVALQQELKESESLSSYQEMKEWLALIQSQNHSKRAK